MFGTARESAALDAHITASDEEQLGFTYLRNSFGPAHISRQCQPAQRPYTLAICGTGPRGYRWSSESREIPDGRRLCLKCERIELGLRKGERGLR